MDRSAIVVRAPNWLGDTVMALPALRALRAGQPQATLIVVGRWARLLGGQGAGDVLLDYPRGWRDRCRLAGRLRAVRPAIAVVLPNSLESALMARWWAAPERIGYDTDGRRALLTTAVPMCTPRGHQVDEYRALVDAVSAAGAGSEPVPRFIQVPAPALEHEAQALLAEVGGDSARLVGLHLGAASGTSKQWPADSFARLAVRLAPLGLTAVLMGSPADAAAAARVIGPDRPDLRSLVGRDRPELLPYLLGRLACLVSGDTGVAHLASALGVPTVTLFGPTSPRLTAPRGPRARAVAGAAPCAPCYLNTCPIDHPCLAGISAEAIARHVQELAA